uniref:Forkhead box N4 n=1 Tax=Panthera tigris altaica TaxID=74533 RepID=A0A8C9MAF2_PANTA
MIESDISSMMSGILQNSGQNHHPSPQEYRLLATTTGEDDLPGDLQSLSWLTAVDVPRLQQMASGRVDLGGPSAPHPHPGALARAASLHVGATPGPLLHGPAGMVPPGMLGLGPIANHRASMNQIPVGGQPSSSLQDQPQLYSPASQTQLPLPPGTQQRPPMGLYGSPFGARPPYPQPHMATAPDGWKNSVRHNLSLNKCFEKVENKMSGSSRKGCLWALNLARIDKMEEEMYKWKRKDLAAIHRSMANPEELDKLISDRPESCRRPGKLGDPEGPVLTHATTVAMAHGRLAVSQLPPQPLMTLSLQSGTLHDQAITPMSPCIGPGGPLPFHVPILPARKLRQRSEVPWLAGGPAGISTQLTQPLLSLKGNLWEEMKDGGFSLDTLGAFGDSPLGCELGVSGLTPVSGGSDQSFPDLQVTGLYAAYSTPDSVAASATTSSSQYLGSPGNKPIALL